MSSSLRHYSFEYKSINLRNINPIKPNDFMRFEILMKNHNPLCFPTFRNKSRTNSIGEVRMRFIEIDAKFITCDFSGSESRVPSVLQGLEERYSRIVTRHLIQILNESSMDLN